MQMGEPSGVYAVLWTCRVTFLIYGMLNVLMEAHGPNSCTGLGSSFSAQPAYRAAGNTRREGWLAHGALQTERQGGPCIARLMQFTPHFSLTVCSQRLLRRQLAESWARSATCGMALRVSRGPPAGIRFLGIGGIVSCMLVSPGER